jgi:hypothetical protein
MIPDDSSPWGTALFSLAQLMQDQVADLGACVSITTLKE